MANTVTVTRHQRGYEWYCQACLESSGSEAFRLRRDADRSAESHRQSGRHLALTDRFPGGAQ